VNESEWFAATDPAQVWWFVKNSVSERRLRLFACGCCRLLCDVMNEASRDFVRVAELFADGRVKPDVADRWRARVESDDRSLDALLGVSHFSAAPIAQAAVQRDRSALVATFVEAEGGTRGEGRHKIGVFRDVIGNLFRPVGPDPRWRTSAAIDLARTMYDSRDFAAMPILADALEEAGCDDAEVLAHCRGDGPHVRGCWVVDLVLGKA
jgi:hypothetical protein